MRARDATHTTRRLQAPDSEGSQVGHRDSCVLGKASASAEPLRDCSKLPQFPVTISRLDEYGWTSTETKEIDAKVFGVVFKLLFDPDFTMIIVLARQRIIAEQKAAPHDAADDMHDAGFIG